MPRWRFTKAKIWRKQLKHSTGERDKNWTGWQNGGSLFCSRCFSSLKTERVRLAGFSAHSCVALELWLEVHHCTAVWLMAEGRRRKTKDKGKRWRSSRTSPAGPGTCPGQQLQLLLWRKVSSAWLPPTSPQFLHLWPLPLSRNLLWAQSSPILPLIPDLNWKTKKGIYQGAIRSLCLCFCALSVVFSAFTPPMTVRQAARGKYVSSPSFKISPPPW